MQLTRSRASALVVLTVVMVRPAPAGAQVEASSRVTAFREHSRKGSGVEVYHPQVDVTAALGQAFRLSAGYEVDVVTGATPAIFGPTSGVDAVTGATKFSDQRHAVRGGVDFGTREGGVSASYSHGWEKDYRSSAVSVAARSDLVEKNFTLGLSYTHNFDRVCDNDNRGAQGPLDHKPLAGSEGCFQAAETDLVTRRLGIDTVEPSLTWTATPRLLLHAGATIQVVDGFQSNPYRSVLVGSQHRTPQEHQPDHRQRYALFARAAHAFPAARASASALLRVYRDTWDVRAGTVELGLHKYLSKFLLVHARGRFHQQGGAIFYRTAEAYRTRGPAGRYWTGDRELSPMRNVLFGGKVAYLRLPERQMSVLQELELAVKVEAIIYMLASEDAPNADRDHALIGQVALTLRF